jgi:hypothetical protein
MSILRRMDVIPKVGKPPLFCVFTMVPHEWLSIMGRYPSDFDLCGDAYAPLYHYRHTLDSRAVPDKVIAVPESVVEPEGGSREQERGDAESRCASVAGDLSLVINESYRKRRLDALSVSSRVTASVYGEAVDCLCVRTVDNLHTVEYASLLHDLSKPSSFDREIYGRTSS